MKIKFDKKLLIAIGISLLVAGGLTALIAIAALFSWFAVLLLISIICLPFIKTLIDIYEEESCIEIKDLWETLTDEEDDYNNDHYLR